MLEDLDHPLMKILDSLNNNVSSCETDCDGCYANLAAIGLIIEYIVKKEQSC